MSGHHPTGADQHYEQGGAAVTFSCGRYRPIPTIHIRRETNIAPWCPILEAIGGSVARPSGSLSAMAAHRRSTAVPIGVDRFALEHAAPPQKPDLRPPVGLVVPKNIADTIAVEVVGAGDPPRQADEGGAPLSPSTVSRPVTRYEFMKPDLSLARLRVVPEQVGLAVALRSPVATMLHGRPTKAGAPLSPSTVARLATRLPSSARAGSLRSARCAKRCPPRHRRSCRPCRR